MSEERKPQVHRAYYESNGRYVCKWCDVYLGTVPKGVWSLSAAGIKITEPCPKAPPPWKLWRINHSLLQNIRKHFGTEPFTNKDAYEIYIREHAVPYREKQHQLHGYKVYPIRAKAPWLQMNVRNTLCKAAYKGILIRLGPGHYKFPEE